MTRYDAIINPVKGKRSPNLGPAAVLVASQTDLQRLGDLMGLREANRRDLLMSRVYVENTGTPSFSLTGPLIGAPYATLLLETLIKWGARKIVFFGWCGAILPEVEIGDIVVPESAIIDEGTSKHYQEGEDALAWSSENISHRITAALEEKGLPYHRGRIWSTDAIFRETREKVLYFQEKKALGVEMEVSALFTVGKFRKVEVGGILVVSDELSGLEWQPGFRDARFQRTREAVCEVISGLCQNL